MSKSQKDLVIFTEEQDRVIRSLAGAADELGVELSLETLVGLSEEVLDELSINKLDSYRSKARNQIIADKNRDTDTTEKRLKGYTKASQNIQKNFVKGKGMDEEVEEIEEKRGLWDNIHAKRKRIKAGSGERMRKPGSEGAPSASDLKAAANEEVQIDEISSDMAHRYLKGKRERDYDISADGKSSSLKKPQSFGKMNRDMKSTSRALRTIEKAKKTNEEVQIDENLSKLSKTDLVANYRKSKNALGNLGRTPYEDREDSGWDERVKHHKDILDSHMAELKRREVKEEVQIDELSKATMGRYINKAKDSIDTASYRQGHKEAHGSSSKPLEKKLTKRHKGVETAVNKLTKEDIDLVEAWHVKLNGRKVSKHFDSEDKAKKFADYGSDTQSGKWTVHKSTVAEALTGDQHKIDANKNGKVDAHDFHLLRKKKKVAEETEVLDEADGGYHIMGKYSSVSWHPTEDEARTHAKKMNMRGGQHYTVKKARSKNMGEEVEALDELSKKTLNSYVVKSLVPSSEKSISNLASKGGYKLGQAHDDDYTAGEKEDAKSARRSLGVLTAVRKLTKEDVINRAINKYIPEEVELPSLEERLVNKLDALQVDEQHIHILLSMFEGLNEQNKNKMLATAESTEGVNSLLDFIISNKSTN